MFGLAGDVAIFENRQSGLFPALNYDSEGYDQAAKRLRIYASHVFGDIKVYPSSWDNFVTSELRFEDVQSPEISGRDAKLTLYYASQSSASIFSC